MNLTKLEAVNRILRAAREHPVSSLGSSTENDSLMAEDILDEVLTREQMTGLHVNTVKTSFTPDSNNQVILPDATLAVAGADQHVHRDYFHKEVNGQIFLFDGGETPASSIFTDDSTVYIRITQRMDFEDLPVQHQFSIVDQAAVEYQEAVLGSSTLGRALEARAARSRAIARAYDMRSRPNNQIRHGRAQGPRAGTVYVPREWPYNDLRKQD